MRFYKYWAQGEASVRGVNRPWSLRVYGGSNDGIEDARRRARKTAERAAAAIERGQPCGTYGYADRPLREEIIEEIHDGDDLSAVITRNSYGALVLNTSRVMFVDVDHFPRINPQTGTGGMTFRELLRELWDSLMRQPSAVIRAREDELLPRFEHVIDTQPGLGARVYRTTGGFRLLVTSSTFEPLASQTHRLMEAFGSDPLYLRLCKQQECFRARLSPKFWRCGAPRPPSRFPWTDPQEEARYRQWEEDYHRRANKFATCQPVASLGEPVVHDAVRPILDTHDRLTILDGAELA